MNNITLQIIARIAALPVIVWLILLLPAGTFDFWEVYVYFGLLLVMMVLALVYFVKHDPGVLKRRLETREKESTQKVVITLMGLAIIAVYLLSGFDRRFEWSATPLWIQVIGFLLVVGGYLFATLVMKQNSFAARTVRVEESQQLVDTGLYGVVRHPMYTGVVAMYAGTPIALGSWYGLAPLLIFIICLQVRMQNEEQVLTNELEGYSDYKQRVHWRLIPGIW
ncbi:MAG: isoprenylcysteine carboxylmethyltransferase family protein [Gammaproteobacteria bacterium]|nr:isoprenylcysteine carboxylmethyltransferase family protein [Gammaproteobacteria bacterium]MDD9957506.1 isoprenylcysteine carboxylmethyltransferase family protein [Gammaproteobacteria bacterium]